ncbi:MAG: hypothetical protein ACR2I0_00180, partial [Rhodoferax sp.]
MATGALAAADLPTIVTGLSRKVDPAPSYLLIGASNASASIGSASAGLALSNGKLGLVLSSAQAGQASATGYALVGSGNVALEGFGNAVSLSASGSLAI